MGQTVLNCASHTPDLQVVGEIDEGDDLRSVIGQGDVIVDFSSHSVTPGIAALCAQHKKAMVIGTTGHSGEGKSQIANFKSQIPTRRGPAAVGRPSKPRNRIEQVVSLRVNGLRDLSVRGTVRAAAAAHQLFCLDSCDPAPDRVRVRGVARQFLHLRSTGATRQLSYLAAAA